MGRARALVRGLAFPVAALAALAAACSFVTHAYDYRVGEPPTACGACAGHPDFARVPCGAEAGMANEDPMSPTYYFVVDAISFGADAGYAVGINQDCAPRADGGAACTPATPWLYPFPTLPNGIENAFGSNVLAPMQSSFPTAIDVEAQVNAWIGAGLGGFVLVVDQWNGLPDDSHVSVRVGAVLERNASGVTYRAIPTSAVAYVTGGKLIAELGEQELDLPFGSTSGALMTVRAFGVIFMGTIDPQAQIIDPMLVAGRIQSGGQLGPLDQGLTDLVRGCADGGTQPTNRAAALIAGAFDLAAPPSTTCTFMTFGFRAHATRLITPPNLDPTPPLRTSCPGPVDAGTPTGDAGNADADADATTD